MRPDARSDIMSIQIYRGLEKDLNKRAIDLIDLLIRVQQLAAEKD